MKKFFALLACCFSCCLSSLAQDTIVLSGDVNHDGKIDVSDVLLLSNMVLGKVTPEKILVTDGAVAFGEAKVESVTMAKTEEVYVGYTKQLVATVLPVNAPIPGLQWKSWNPALATVDQNGVVKGLKPGTARITANAIDGSGMSATCVVTVKAASSGTEGSGSDIDGDGDW